MIVSKKIRNTMVSLDRNTKLKEDIAEYRYFLKLNVKLLAELDKLERIDVVMKELLPNWSLRLYQCGHVDYQRSKSLS